MKTEAEKVADLFEHDRAAWRALGVIRSSMSQEVKNAVWGDLTRSQQDKLRGLL